MMMINKAHLKKLILFLIIGYSIPFFCHADVVLVADKKHGKLAVIDLKTKKILYNEPALYGKSKDNTLNLDYYNKNIDSPGITPSGPYTVEKKFSLRLNEPMLVFIDGEEYVGAIHPLWMTNPDKNRVNRLLSKTADDNHITNGCINVHPDFFYNVLNKLPNDTVLNILPE